jgi:translation elongation factor 1 epsilon-1
MKMPKFKVCLTLITDRTFLAGNFQTESDEFMYTALHPWMERLTFSEKEKFVNVSRWFAHVQSFQNGRSQIPFSRTLLYTTSCVA